MTGSNKKPAQALEPSSVSADYDIGYGKPPVHTRFKPGVSGNPRGRPRRAKNQAPALNEERLKDIILQEAYRSITVRDGAQNVSVPMAQAVMRSLAVNAAKGDHRSQRLFSELLSHTERQNKALHDEWLETAINYKVEWERELDRREKLGIEVPLPIPHPDDIEIDMRTGGVLVKGPMTKEQKAELDKWKVRKAEAEKDRDWLVGEMAKTRDPKRRSIIERDMAHNDRMLEIYRRVIPD
ncbi:DUF5681 domain-containing protein [Euryhalocaulis caribicus]|uniref:DUF5681 domain-containing protein n=1 Tax=Euryhalocaulis caribicus TaxID=1161401 RepID=UPI00039A6F71|nr:DUF5681 domain-containing protein [Euryhalocaulis caribicus]